MEKLAYALATVRHEVGPNMLPIIENMNYSAKRMMQVWPSRFPTLASAKPYANNPQALGNKVYGGRLGNGMFDGYKFRGRGIGAQITGYDSYKKYGDLLGIDMVSNPDLAMDLDIGAKILVLGFTDYPFTGYKISNSINNSKVDFLNARRTVNADVVRVGHSIANDANKFLKILQSSNK
jgi:putative chitinase